MDWYWRNLLSIIFQIDYRHRLVLDQLCDMFDIEIVNNWLFQKKSADYTMRAMIKQSINNWFTQSLPLAPQTKQNKQTMMMIFSLYRYVQKIYQHYRWKWNKNWYIWNLVQWHNSLYSCGIFGVLIYSCLLHI